MNSRVGITPRAADGRANPQANTTPPTTPSAPPPPAPAGAPILPIGAGRVTAVLAAYAHSLGAPFDYDDGPAITANPTIRRLWPLADVLLPPAEGGLTVSGRPVLHLSLVFNYTVSGTAVGSYPAVNLLTPAASALLRFGLMRRTLVRPGWRARYGDAAGGWAFIIATEWALHPLQSQAVTYTVQRAESLMGFFDRLALYAFARGTAADSPEDARRRWFGGAVAGSWRAAWRERGGFYGALRATWVLLAARVLSTGGNRGGTVGFGVGVPRWAYPLTQFKAVARYLQLALWPHPLVFEYGTFRVERPARWSRLPPSSCRWSPAPFSYWGENPRSAWPEPSASAF